MNEQRKNKNWYDIEYTPEQIEFMEKCRRGDSFLKPLDDADITATQELDREEMLFMIQPYRDTEEINMRKDATDQYRAAKKKSLFKETHFTFANYSRDDIKYLVFLITCITIAVIVSLAFLFLL